MPNAVIKNNVKSRVDLGVILFTVKCDARSTQGIPKCLQSCMFGSTRTRRLQFKLAVPCSVTVRWRGKARPSPFLKV